MSLNLTTMKARLIWHEYLPHAESKVYPSISFDDGLTWMDIDSEVDYLRTVGEIGLNNKITKDKITEMDVSVGFTPYSIPKIEKLEYVLSGNGSTPVTNFISTTATTYYFAVGAINYDTPGLNVVAESEHISYSGLINSEISVPYMSNVKSITIPDDGKYYNVNIYVNYPEFIEGLCIYYGTSASALNLMSITNLHQKLNGSTSSTVIVANSTTSVVLANKFPLPTARGMIKIDDEYMEYTAQTHNGSNWVLTLNSPAVKNHYGGATVMYCLPGEKTQLPDKEHFFPNTSNMVQYINFDSDGVHDLVNHYGEEDYLAPSTVGSIETSTFLSKYKKSYRLVGNTCVRTNLSTTNRTAVRDTGSIHFYTALSSFDTNTSSDPYIFGTYDTTGLYCRISKFNSKPYLGYKYVSGTDIIDTVIFSYEDYRTPVLKKTEFSDIGIAWKKDTDNYMIFYLVVDGVVNMSSKTSILNTNFDIGNLTIGGLYNGSNVVNSFVGYLDDWRIYNKNLADGSYSVMFPDISRNHYNDYNRFAGKLTLGFEFVNISGLTSYDTVSATNLLSDGTASGGSTYYTPAFYTSVSLPYSASYAIDEPLVKYDNWVIDSYIMGGWTSSVTDITYPVRPDRIKIKYDLLDDSTGFYTPIIGNPSVIISEITV